MPAVGRCCAKPRANAGAAVTAASRKATAAATKAAKAAAKGCPSGGCKGVRATFVSPKKPNVTKARPCKCGS